MSNTPSPNQRCCQVTLPLPQGYCEQQSTVEIMPAVKSGLQQASRGVEVVKVLCVDNGITALLVCMGRLVNKLRKSSDAPAILQVHIVQPDENCILRAREHHWRINIRKGESSLGPCFALVTNEVGIVERGAGCSFGVTSARELYNHLSSELKDALSMSVCMLSDSSVSESLWSASEGVVLASSG